MIVPTHEAIEMIKTAFDNRIEVKLPVQMSSSVMHVHVNAMDLIREMETSHSLDIEIQHDSERYPYMLVGRVAV